MRSILCLVAGLTLFGGAAFADDVPVAPAPVAPVPVAPPSGPVATMETSLGTITITLDTVHAPVSVANFVRYARDRHFNGTVFYRVEPGFVIQAGSYTADGHFKGGVRPPIALEANNGLHNARGTIAMARGDAPVSADAEFFINVADNGYALDAAPADTANKTGYAVFGQVTGGLDVVDAINAVPTHGGVGPFPDAAPVTPVTILKVTIADPVMN